jgi:peptide/nickel transport system ATP-binding protein
MTRTAAPLLHLDGLSVAFGGVDVVRGIDLAVAPGEAVGMVGESGCGKSVTWLGMLGLLPRQASVRGSARLLDGAAGTVELIGATSGTRDRIRGGRIAMIFQDPASALNPVHTVGRQVMESLGLHRGLRGSAARAEARRLFDQVGIPDATRRLDAYPHELSGGQNQRAMIAMALAGQPELLIADEPTTALDVTIQAQILDLLNALRRETGMALVLISHDLGVVSETCDRVAVMYAGRIVEEAPTAAFVARPAHPYASGLLDALPPLDGPRAPLRAIPGQVPAAGARPAGCAFAPRCPYCETACTTAEPPLTPREPGHFAACRRDPLPEARAA